MKIYAPAPADLIRLQICQQGKETQYITLCDTTRAQVVAMIEKILVQQKVSIFAKGSRTSVNIREAKGSKNGRSTSVSFYGLDPEKVCKLITDHIAKQISKA